MNKFFTPLIIFVFFSCSSTTISSLYEKFSTDVFVPIYSNKQNSLPKIPKGADIYQVGTGISDITAEPLGNVMGGYADPSQSTQGILDRLYARAFIFKDSKNNMVAYVNVDQWSMSLAVREDVILELSKNTLKNSKGVEIKLRDSEGKNFFNEKNIMLIATHTHCGVTGLDESRMYNISGGGKNERVYKAMVSGVVDAILIALDNMRPSYILFGKGELLGLYNVNHNRSLEAHLNNISDKKTDLTLDEFNQYNRKEKFIEKFKKEYSEKTMYLLKIKSAEDNSDIGAISWYPIHPTSISATMRLISGDCKGFAEQQFEDMMGSVQGNGKDFISAFSQTATGDCGCTRLIYRNGKYAYNDNDELKNVMFASIAQSARAMEIYSKANTPISGDISSAANYIDFSNVKIEDKFRYKPEKYLDRTVPAAVGYSAGVGSEIHTTILAGTLWEGMTTENGARSILVEFAQAACWPFRNLKDTWQVGAFMSPTKEIKEMHKPKIVLSVPSNTTPDWIAQTLPLQVIKIGSIVLFGTPFEETFVSGKRIERVVENTLKNNKIKFEKVLSLGYCNAYGSYLTSPEEYEMQHYEGGFTQFGINQLPAVLQESERLVNMMANNISGRQPNDPNWIKNVADRLETNQIVHKRIYSPIDYVLAGTHFGKLIGKIKKDVEQGENMRTEFVFSNPNENLLHNDSFYLIQRYIPELEKWTTVYRDTDIFTRMRLKNTSSYTNMVVDWIIPESAMPGTYRYVIQGQYKKLGLKNDTGYFSSVSDTFTVHKVEREVLIGGRGSENVISRKDSVTVNRVILKIKPDFKNYVAQANLIFDDGSTYPIKNMSIIGEATVLRIPNKQANKIKFEIVALSSESYKPEIVEFSAFHDQDILPSKTIYVGHQNVQKIDNFIEILSVDEDDLKQQLQSDKDISDEMLHGKN